MKEKTMKVWVTKYWETRGIYEEKVTRGAFSESDDKYVYSIPERGGGVGVQYILGRTAFETELDAKVKVAKLRNARLVALKKTIQKLERMKI